MPKLSIIIISYNTKNLLDNCISDIISILSKLPSEIIVVDNNSTDGTKEMLFYKWPQVEVILNNENLGYGIANNIGMKKSKGTYILLLNSDTRLSIDVIVDSINLLDNSKYYSVLGCRLNNKDYSFQPSCGKFYNLSNAFVGGLELNKYLEKINIFNFRFNAYLLSERNCSKIISVDWITGAFMLFKSEVFKKTNGFDENYFMYGEEYEWCFRIKKEGFNILYYPNKSIVHYGGGSAGSELSYKKRVLFELKGREYFYKKHYGFLKMYTFRGLLLIASLIKMPIYFVMCKLFPQNYNYKEKLIFQFSVMKWFFTEV